VGLDDVELIMEAEDEFGVTLPDDFLVHAATVGEFYDAILPLVRAGGKAELRARQDLATYLWERVRALAAEQARVPPESLSRETRFVEDLGLG
jgi:acyl carrier protein